MQPPDFAAMDDEHLADLLFVAEDRLERPAVDEIARRPGIGSFLGQLIMDKQSWLAELPDWWAVVHATYILGLKAGEEAVLPLLCALRWADAFDNDWVTELLPSILGRVGPATIPGLTMVVRDQAAGWSARDLGMKGLAAVSLNHPQSEEHVFRLIGERFMDEGEERLVRQLAGQILLDFRRENYRMALLKFAREEQSYRDLDMWYPGGFDAEDVEWTFRQPQPDTWHYREDWLRFYEPSEIQRRQKRWARERMTSLRAGKERALPAGGGRVLPLWRLGKSPQTPDSTSKPDPEDSQNK